MVHKVFFYNRFVDFLLKSLVKECFIFLPNNYQLSCCRSHHNWRLASHQIVMHMVYKNLMVFFLRVFFNGWFRLRLSSLSIWAARYSWRFLLRKLLRFVVLKVGYWTLVSIFNDRTSFIWYAYCGCIVYLCVLVSLLSVVTIRNDCVLNFAVDIKSICTIFKTHRILSFIFQHLVLSLGFKRIFYIRLTFDSCPLLVLHFIL